MCIRDRLLAVEKMEEPTMKHVMEMAVGMYEVDEKRMEYTRDLSEKMIQKRAWERMQQVSMPKTTREVLELYHVNHPEVSNDDLVEMEKQMAEE